MKNITKLDIKDFKKSFSKYYPNNTVPNTHFLEWFIGFSEGDGSFIINNSSKPTCTFVITQSTKDIQVIYYIQNKMGFGNVIKQGNTTSRYIVQKQKDIEILINLFNGNLVLPKNFYKYSLWIKCFNNKFKPIIFKNQMIIPNFNTYWISGFTDAEGHFGCSILANSKAYRYRFMLAQKGQENIPALASIQKVLGGKVESHSIKNVYQLVVNGVSNMKNLINYFDEHPLFTKKKKSYSLWKDIGNDLFNKKHLTTSSRKELKIKTKLINKLK
uniref:Putative LAGLIDADG homing endonuclease n=1 Tax=Malassezia furfur TaxID=55194 RepID=A0A8K1MGA9_MALFU|nr:putative LAGLIDADG homing endonuclease [Malassezia furfur]UBU96653.1 putative LAGLIDADG homing endonuclease [Malassezia furfur]UBU96674.1 putative LAGLIDADG homing endonuclease [Malassezia furfur]